jgi:hypothetical protein
MSQVLEFDSTMARPKRVPLRVIPRGDDMDPFWPQISSRHDASEELTVDPANAPARVLSEIGALFSAVGLLILVVTLFVPGS